MRTKIWAGAIACAAIAIGGIACGSDDSETGTAADGSVSEVQGLDDGVFTVASEVAYPPFEYFEPGSQTPKGFDIDLANALGEELGVDVEIKNTAFDALIPGLASGRFDVAISALYDTLERQRVITFVDYYEGNYDFIVKADSNLTDLTPDTLCGLTYAVVKGSANIPWYEDRSAECEDRGEDPITISLVGSSDAELFAVQSGRADFAAAIGPVAEFATRESDQLAISGEPHSETVNNKPQYGGVGIPKDNQALVDAVNGALGTLMENGTYDDIAHRWGMDCCTLDEPIVNGGTT